MAEAQGAPAGASAAADELARMPIVILDVGSGFVKAGLAGDAAPRVIFRSIVAYSAAAAGGRAQLPPPGPQSPSPSPDRSSHRTQQQQQQQQQRGGAVVRPPRRRPLAVGDDCLRLFATRGADPEGVVIDRPVHVGGAARNGDGWLALARRAVAMVAATLAAAPAAAVRVMVLEPPSPVAASTVARLYSRLMDYEEEEEEDDDGDGDREQDDGNGVSVIGRRRAAAPVVRIAAVLPRPSAPLALMSRGRTTGLVVDVGEGGAWAAPVVDGDALLLGARRSPAGGALAAEWALEAVLRPAARRRQQQEQQQDQGWGAAAASRHLPPPLPSCAWWAAEVEDEDGSGKKRLGGYGGGGSSGGGAGWTILAGHAPSSGGGRGGGGAEAWAGGEEEKGTSGGGAGGPAVPLPQDASAAAHAALAFLRARKDAGALAAARTAVAAHRAGTLERLALLERGRLLACRSAAREQARATAAAAGGGGNGGNRGGKEEEDKRALGAGQGGAEVQQHQHAAGTSPLPLLLSPSLAGADGPGVAAVAAAAVREGAGVDLRRPLLGCVLLTGGVGAALEAPLAAALRSELARHWPALPVRVLLASGGSEGGGVGGGGGGSGALATAAAGGGWAAGAHAAFAGAASLAESLLERGAPCCAAEGWLLPTRRTNKEGAVAA